MVSVVFEKCGYQQDKIKALVDISHDCLGVEKKHHGKTVLLKPNLISVTAPPLACTDARFVAAVAEWYLDNGARVLLGDSPAFGSCRKVCERVGIGAALSRLKVEIIEFSEVRTITLQSGLKVPVALAPLAADLLVGLPKVKAHNQMYVTLAVKNLFGTIRGTKKASLHMIHGKSHEQFAAIIMDLVELFPAQRHFADGIEAMHIAGPMGGRRLHLGAFGAATNPVALDTALLQLLELECERSPLWNISRKRNILGSALAAIDFPRLTPGDFLGSGFMAPEELNSIRFNPLRFCRNFVRKVVLKLARH